MPGKYQRVLLRAASERDLAVSLNFDFVDAPVDEVEDRTRIRGVLVFFLRHLVLLVRHFVRPDVSSFPRFREITVKGGNRGRVAVVVNEKVWAVSAWCRHTFDLLHGVSHIDGEV